MAWPKALIACGAWVVAHALGGLLFAAFAVLVPATEWWVIIIHGLAAGAIFGLGQWLVLRWFLPGINWWLPVTAAASPFSWYVGIWMATATLTFGGWLGSAFSAVAQQLVLWLYFYGRKDEWLAWVSTIYLPGAVLGGAIFYFSYLFSASMPGHYTYPLLQSMLIGSVGFAAVTGVAVAVLVGLAGRRAAQKLSGAVVKTMKIAASVTTTAPP